MRLIALVRDNCIVTLKSFDFSDMLGQECPLGKPYQKRVTKHVFEEAKIIEDDEFFDMTPP